jgi:hypothetical protein
MRSSKFDSRRQPRRPAARRIPNKKIITGLLLLGVVIFLASVIGGLFR